MRRGDVTLVQWIDYRNYIGPDRRKKGVGLRLFERRSKNLSGAIPALGTSLNQLRLRVIEARGEGARDFANRAKAIAELAKKQNQHEVAAILDQLAAHIEGAPGMDLREEMYRRIDRAIALLNR